MNKSAEILNYLENNNLEGVLICEPANRRYYTGFTGSTGFALFTKGGEPRFLCDSRYTNQASQQCKGFKIVHLNLPEELYAHIKSTGTKNLGIEAGHISWQFANALLDKAGVKKLHDIQGFIDGERLIKSPEEAALLRKACMYADKALSHTLGLIHEDITEAEIDFHLRTYLGGIEEVERTMERYIIASGERGALPHGLASGRRAAKGDMVMIDFGCCVGGYWSDMTRTVCIGKPSSRKKEIYGIVRHAQESALKAVKPGKKVSEIDSAAREIIAAAGYGKNFGHGLGHGLGLTLRELPILSPNPAEDLVLKPGMVATIEPGIYLDGLLGIRIEDDILVTETGCEILTNTTKELIEL